MENTDNKKGTQNNSPCQSEVNDLEIMNAGAITAIKKYIKRISQLLTVFCLIILFSLTIRVFGKNGLTSEIINNINDISVAVSLFIIFLIVSIVEKVKSRLNKFDYVKDKKVSQSGYVRSELLKCLLLKFNQI